MREKRVFGDIEERRKIKKGLGKTEREKVWR